MKFYFQCLLAMICFAVIRSLQAAERPISAEIVDVASERKDWGEPIGNIRVKYAGGRSELWTRLGRCMHVRCSESGIVGWTRYTSRNLYGDPVNSILRIMVATDRWLDFQAGPFIEDWLFSERDTTVIVRSRGRHGPSTIQRFSLTTGKLIDSTKGSDHYADTPDWAKPLADNQPE